jgi:hypothetical protein
MKNAHERFGKLVYRRRTEKTATNFAFSWMPLLGEDRGKAHLVSVVGGDVEIGALAAAFANGDSFTVEDPYGEESIVSLGEKPLCFRGSDRGSRTETAAEASCELLAGTGGHHLGWETAPDQRRPIFHLVFAGASLRPARHARMGPWMISQLQSAKADSASSRIWIRRSRRQGQAESVIGAASEGAAQQSARVFLPKMGPVEWPEIQLVKKTA